jgi:hypothetical protein
LAEPNIEHSDEVILRRPPRDSIQVPIKANGTTATSNQVKHGDFNNEGAIGVEIV